MCRVKICGLKRPEDVELVDEVADYAGFVVAHELVSPRRLSLREAADLASVLSRAKPVLVLAARGPGDAIDAVLRAGVFKTLQYHAYLAPGAAGRVASVLRDHGVGFSPVLFYDKSSGSLRPGDPVGYSSVGYEYLLVDSLDRGGGGLRVPLSVYRSVASRAPRVAAAGGINPSNVGMVVETGVWMVDCSSGVESRPGVKNHELVLELVRRCHSRCGAL